MTAKDHSTREKRNARIVEMHDHGYSERQIARAVGISRSAVWGVIQAEKRSRIPA